MRVALGLGGRSKRFQNVLGMSQEMSLRMVFRLLLGRLWGCLWICFSACLWECFVCGSSLGCCVWWIVFRVWDVFGLPCWVL